MDKREDKQQVKSLIISLFIVLLSISCLSQINAKDSVGLKKDFEKLLSKYGIKSKGYLINVISVNQKGGQTAFIINNNYYADTLADSINIGFHMDTVKNILQVYPIKGIWIQPFVATDSSIANLKMFDHEPNYMMAFVKELSYIEGDHKYTLTAFISNVARSQVRPLNINLTNAANEYYLFGDWVNPNKRYLFFNRSRITWVPSKP